MVDPELVGNPARVVDIIQRAASARRALAHVFVRTQPQGDAGNVVSVPEKQERGNGAVHAAAHAEHYFFLHISAQSSVGWVSSSSSAASSAASSDASSLSFALSTMGKWSGKSAGAISSSDSGAGASVLSAPGSAEQPHGQ